MCASWSLLAKLIELTGAVMLIVPLYKAAIVQWSYLHAADRHVRNILANLLESHAADRSKIDTVALAAAIINDKPVILANRFSTVEMLIIILGGIMVLTGGAFEILERGHLHGAICAWLDASVRRFF